LDETRDDGPGTKETPMTDEDRVVLLVEFDRETRGLLGGWLENAGFQVMSCPGPSGPEYMCVGTRVGRCPLVADADVVLLDLWLASDSALLGTPATELLSQYVSWGKPVVVLRHGRDPMPLWFLEDSVAWLDWPSERHELIETVRLLANGGKAGYGQPKVRSGSSPARWSPRRDRS
jgi:hypothetical protein